MKLDCGKKERLKKEAKKKKISGWHEWYAWYPVKVAEEDCRWLETILRKPVFYYSNPNDISCWQYKSMYK